MTPDKADLRVYFEPQHNRWHSTFQCGVIAASEDIELVLCRVPPPNSRPCSVCVTVRPSCD